MDRENATGLLAADRIADRITERKLVRHGADQCGAGDLGDIADAGERLGPCPSCGASIEIGLAPDPLNGYKRTRVLLHVMPFCTYFGITDTDQIASDIEAARKKHEA